MRGRFYSFCIRLYYEHGRFTDEYEHTRNYPLYPQNASDNCHNNNCDNNLRRHRRKKDIPAGITPKQREHEATPFLAHLPGRARGAGDTGRGLAGIGVDS